MIITFSGLDGAGKSTLIATLKKDLESKKHKVTLLTMYDHISFYSFIRTMRDGLKKLLGIKNQKIGPSAVSPDSSPQFSSNPHDPKIIVDDKKNLIEKHLYRIIRSQALRKAVLFLDILVLLYYRLKIEAINGEILMTDRYLYDSLADVADLKNRKWGFIRALMHIIPEPIAPIFVDVPAEKAYERKKEYPIDYMKWRRTAYQKIFSWTKNPIILFNDNFEDTVLKLLTEVNQRIRQCSNT